jgi:hypothetical protein
MTSTWSSASARFDKAGDLKAEIEANQREVFELLRQQPGFKVETTT